MTFAAFSFNNAISKALAELNYDSPTDIQQQAIPVILKKHDLMARAQTGTGKTAAFALPILQHLIEQNKVDPALRVLVLTPTRELAKQVHKSFTEYSQYTPLQSALAYGGVSAKEQAARIAQGVDILVATPGRLIDHLQSGIVSLDDVQYLVFDEADRMLDMGFKDEIDKILTHLSVKRQTLLFSATFNDEVYKVAKKLLTDAECIEIDAKNTVASEIEQIVYMVDADKKRELTSFLIGSKNWQQVLIFTRTKATADALAKEMCKDGIKAQSIHGDKSQGAREKALADFKTGKVRALVATDVAARGIDINELGYVINYELPHQAEDYIHRIGRTARAGKSGLAVSLLSPSEEWLLEAIEKILDYRLLQQWFPGYEPDLNKVTLDAMNAPKLNKKKARQQALAGKKAGQSKRRLRR
ncbi:DEAD/DEAH box helicase [Colwellia asteriadis]|uniref:DEAD/DEAH box helicase n=1 Tax=Colwellia asteriadis TaxID=517723 RepID=A0ABP3WMW3_9GAMM